MEYALLLGLVLFKHGVLAHVVDVGYGACRNPQYHPFTLSLMKYCTFEALVSIVLWRVVFVFSWEGVVAALVAEHLALVVSSLVERRAPVSRLIRTHLMTESGVALVYALTLWDLVYG